MQKTSRGTSGILASSCNLQEGIGQSEGFDLGSMPRTDLKCFLVYDLVLVLSATKNAMMVVVIGVPLHEISIGTVGDSLAILPLVYSGLTGFSWAFHSF